MKTKWIKLPQPGQFRGEGTWVEAQEFFSPQQIEEIEISNYLPVRTSEEMPKD